MLFERVVDGPACAVAGYEQVATTRLIAPRRSTSTTCVGNFLSSWCFITQRAEFPGYFATVIS